MYTTAEVMKILNVSRETLRRWERAGKLIPHRHPINGYKLYSTRQLAKFEEIVPQLSLFKEEKKNTMNVKPLQTYRSIELFAGAGGLALGMEMAGLKHALLSEIDRDACATLRFNRPKWNVVEGDVGNLDFNKYRGKVDVVTGGFPCQAFSYAGKRL